MTNDTVYDIYNAFCDLADEYENPSGIPEFQGFYSVRLSWYDIETKQDIQPEKYYVFLDADDALAFAYDVAYTDMTNEYGNPIDVYVDKVPVIRTHTKNLAPAMEVGTESFIANYIGCSDYFKDNKRR